MFVKNGLRFGFVVLIFTSYDCNKLLINPNKAGLFEGRFSWDGGVGGQFDPPPVIFQEKLI